ncbi:MAG TPA: hypothetical protein DCE42_29835 [Myxococcales bacterium]|nr:hypothetical protein [Deltaproteobacteria bacterium]HAA58993.1 hypothetical protein [Myxococcales bacterium]|tara:strand:+ start:4034 stop:4957 length:924 start_codon:yes stop_codon:yes gene_type:complete
MQTLIASIKGTHYTTKDAFDILIRTLYKTIRFQGGIYDNVKYMELPNPWGGEGHEADETLCCTHLSFERGECALAQVERIEAPLEDIVLRWEWDEDIAMLIEDLIDEREDDPADEDLPLYIVDELLQFYQQGTLEDELRTAQLALAASLLANIHDEDVERLKARLEDLFVVLCEGGEGRQKQAMEWFGQKSSMLFEEQDERTTRLEGLASQLEELPHEVDRVVFEGTLTLQNLSGENTDHRGADHCLLILPFRERITLHHPTVRELVEALFVVKSHKFDTWYELYCGCTLEEGDDGVVISLEMDHGS